MKSIRSEAKAICDKFYSTGKECVRGHIDKRYTSNGMCFSCYKLKCNSKVRVDRAAKWNKENKERRKEITRKNNKKTYEDNKIVRLTRANNWRLINKEHVNSKQRERRSTTIGKIKSFIRASLARSFTKKEKSALLLVGYSTNELMVHISNLFKDGMTWDNHGDWHIDHIIPIDYFIKNKIHDPKIINSLSNLQPLWANENQSKGAKYNVKSI
tara:strand:- start:140 stop:778 length:639 start_codon:yes stop_codon:yes gene_type:complete